MRSAGKISVLYVGQDNLFADLPGCVVDHLSTGTTITPTGVQSHGSFGRLTAIMSRVCAGKYDLIVLPAVDFRWEYDISPFKRALRFLVSNVMRCGPTCVGVNRVLSRRATRIIILDRYDSHEPLVDYLKCLTSASYYFKTNLRETDNDQLYPSGTAGGCQFKHLPYWIAVENYQVPFHLEKDIDVFFAGTVNCEYRRVAIDMVRQLSSDGYRIKIVEGRLPFADYLAYMSRSWLTLSPQGYGYNGFRHYESMLVGSIPLINLPDPPVVNDFHHGHNCFLYSTRRADLDQIIKNILSDKARLLQIAKGLREFVINHHSLRAVGSYLLRQAVGDCDRKMMPYPAQRFDSEFSEVIPAVSQCV